MIIFILIFIVILIYYILTTSVSVSEYHIATKEEVPVPIKERVIKPMKINLISALVSNKFMDKALPVAINTNALGMYVTVIKSKAEVFKLIQGPLDEPKPYVLLLSTTNQYLLSINYTNYFQHEYDTLLNGASTQNTTCHLYLKKFKRDKYNTKTYLKGTKYYIQFANKYYLSIDSNSILYASSNKEHLFVFKIKKIKKESELIE